ncbi:ammonium transporter [Planctomicrobium sp.]|nr:ammonium transporter [Planctomicrobium sp.]
MGFEMKRWIALGPLVLFVAVFAVMLPTSSWAQDAVEVTESAETTEVVEEEAAEEEAETPMTLEQYQADMNYAFNTMLMLVCAVLVIFMQAGFAMVEVGLNSQKNAVNILSKNLMDLCVGVMLFWLFGFNLMYPGEAYAGDWLGTFTPFVDRDTTPDLAYGLSHSTDFMFQVAFAATAATIVSGAVAGRMKFSSYLVYSAILTGLIYPISGMWKWGGGALDAQGFQDFAGSVVVHAVGGFAGLAGALALGPRIGRFGADGKSRPMPGHNITLAALGVFILWVGWYGFNPGSQLAYATAGDAEATTYIALTTTLAAAAGGIAALITGWCIFKKPDLTMGLNGVLAGLVGITANCDRVEQGEAVIIGAVAGVLVVAAIIALEKLRIDDPVGAFPVHGVCGVWGGIATGIFGNIPLDDFPEMTRMGFLIVQIKSTAIICVWAFVTMGIVFYALKAMGQLRVTEEEEVQGLDINEHGMHAYTTT